MNDNQITRINELYHKGKNQGLTEEEKEEQVKLRKDYIASIRRNLRGQLNQVSLVNPDGTITDLSTKDKSNEKES